MTDWIPLFCLAALLWFWLDGLRAKELARAAGERACADADLQFLDDTVSVGLSLRRLALRRTYRFEFTDTGDRRLEGEVVLMGHKVESVNLEPYRILH